jgi:hypothetical protein
VELLNTISEKEINPIEAEAIPKDDVNEEEKKEVVEEKEEEKEEKDMRPITMEVSMSRDVKER